MRTLFMAALLAAPALCQTVGDDAPDYSCAGWANVAEGAKPAPAELKGKLVLLEFWFST